MSLINASSLPPLHLTISVHHTIYHCLLYINTTVHCHVVKSSSPVLCVRPLPVDKHSQLCRLTLETIAQ